MRLSVPMGALLASTLLVGVAGSACAQVVLNEVLAAPSADWTSSGESNSTQDEWIEIVNAGGSPASVDGYFVTDANLTPRFGLSGTLDAGEHLFVTGEAASDWESSNGFPSVGLSLNNSADTVILFQAAGGTTTLVDSLSYVSADMGPDVSLGRLPDGTGSWTAFDALTESGTGPQPTPESVNGGVAAPKILDFVVEPGFPSSSDPIRVAVVAADTDGISESFALVRIGNASPDTLSLALVSGLPRWGTWELTLPPFAGGTQVGVRVFVSDGALLEATNERIVEVMGEDSPIALNEILADPPAGLDGDANGDGTRNTSQDEFVEIVNRSNEVVDLSGWSLHDATGLRHEFASGVTLGAGQYFVVFGGGTPTNIPSATTVASSGTLSLNNTSEEVRLVDSAGLTRDVHAYGSEGNTDQSLVRVPDGDGAWTRPSVAGFSWRFSPGVPNASPAPVTQASWAQIKSLYQDDRP